MPLLALHLPKSCTKAVTRVPQIITYVAVEKGMEHKGEALVESTGATCTAVGKKACLGTKQCRTVENQARVIIKLRFLKY